MDFNKDYRKLLKRGKYQMQHYDSHRQNEAGMIVSVCLAVCGLIMLIAFIF